MGAASGLGARGSAASGTRAVKCGDRVASIGPSPRLVLFVVWCGLFLLSPACAEPTQRPEEGSRLPGVVVRVFDGDSFIMRSAGRRVEVRVFGIDAPEKGQPFSARARERARDLLQGSEVTVAVRAARDAYGRVVGEVLLPDGRDYAGVLVSEGLAWQYRRYSKDARIADLERRARERRRGLWRDQNPQAPWDYRHQRRKGNR